MGEYKIAQLGAAQGHYKEAGMIDQQLLKAGVFDVLEVEAMMTAGMLAAVMATKELTVVTSEFSIGDLLLSQCSWLPQNGYDLD